MENIFIGCDVSKSKIDYCVLSKDKDKNNSFYGQFKNSLDGYEKFFGFILFALAISLSVLSSFKTSKTTLVLNSAL